MRNRSSHCRRNWRLPVRILVVAPHPDDELLGCGGTLLKRVDDGNVVGWVLMTSIKAESGWNTERIEERNLEIQCVRQGLGISTDHFYNLGFPTSELDQISTNILVSTLSSVFKDFGPEEVFLPHPGDIHSDHRITFEAAAACTKWFRYPSVKRILTYETFSETDFGLDQVAGGFRPNLFVDIMNQLDQKTSLLSIYRTELGNHPFPRSLDAVRAQALLRGAQRGVRAAEAFQILKAFE
jgi:LmbE family N-acetylglucosaminyl deacetylase